VSLTCKVFRGSFQCLCVPSPTYASAVLLALVVVIVMSWAKQEDISLLWLGAQERAEMTRTGTFLSLHPIRHTEPESYLLPPRNSPQGCAKSCSDTYFRRTTSASSRLAPTLLRATTPSSPSSLRWFDVDPVRLEVCVSAMVPIYIDILLRFHDSRVMIDLGFTCNDKSSIIPPRHFIVASSRSESVASIPTACIP